MGDHRLHALARSRDPGHRLGGQALRRQARLPRVARALHRRLGAVRVRDLRHRADPVPRRARRGRRDDPAARPADDGACRRPAADGPRDEHRRGARHARTDPRADARRPHPRQRELALDLLRQRPDRAARVRRLASRPSERRQGGRPRPARHRRPRAHDHRPPAPHLRARRDRRDGRRLEREGDRAAARRRGAHRPLHPARPSRHEAAPRPAPLPSPHLLVCLDRHVLPRRRALRRDDPDAAVLAADPARERRRHRPPHRPHGPRDGGRDAARRKAHRPLRRRAAGAPRRRPHDRRDRALRLHRRAHLDPVALARHGRARDGRRLRLHAGDVGGLRLAPALRALRRDTAAQRPAAGRRLDRDGTAGRRPAALAPARPHVERGRRRLRHGVLVVGGADGPRDRAVHRPSPGRACGEAAAGRAAVPHRVEPLAEASHERRRPELRGRPRGTRRSSSSAPRSRARWRRRGGSAAARRTGPARSATPSTTCCTASPARPSSRRASSRPRPTSPPPP